MSFFENRRFVIFTISVLVLINLALIATFAGPSVFKKDWDFRKKEHRKSYVAKKIGFSEQQKLAYDSLNTTHRSKVQKLQKQINENRREVYRLSRTQSVSADSVKALTEHIGILVGEIEFVTFEHISNIRAICTPEQLVTLDSLFQKMIRYRGNRAPDRNGPPSLPRGKN